MTKTPRPRRIGELLTEPGSTLAGLSGGARVEEDLRRTVANALPAQLRPHLLAAAIADGALILSVDSPDQASRIRFHQDPCLEAVRRSSGEGILSLRVRVRR